MRNSVVFPTDIYKVTASEAEESKSLTVYTTLTGECTMQETNKAPEEIRTESRGWRIENIRFKNVDIRGCTEELYPSVIKSRAIEENETEEPGISGVVFENVTIDNQPITKEHFRIECTPYSVAILP